MVKLKFHSFQLLFLFGIAKPNVVKVSLFCISLKNNNKRKIIRHHVELLERACAVGAVFYQVKMGVGWSRSGMKLITQSEH